MENIQDKKIPQAIVGSGMAKNNLPATPKKMSPYDSALQQKMAQKGAEENAAKLKETKPTLTEKVKNYVDDKQQKYAQKFGKDDIEYPENKVVSQKDEQLLNQTGGIDMTGEAAKTGATTNKLLQNVETPRWKRKSLKDIWNDPEMKDVRGGILANAVGTALANFSGGLSGTNPNYQSDLAKFNEEQAANYSKMQAEKDQQAQQANIDAIKAANAQKVALETKLADTVADRYIKQFNAASDVEIKNQVLNQMIEDADTLFSNENFTEQDLFDLATYMGLLSGDFSLTTRLVQKYVPQLLDKLGGLKTVFGNMGIDTSDTTTPTPEKKNNLGEDLVYGTPNAPVTEEIVNSNPDDYVSIPMKDGTNLVVRKYHGTNVAGPKTTDAEKNEILKTLAQNANYSSPEELNALVAKWAPLSPGMTNEMSKVLKSIEGEEKLNKDYETKINNIINSSSSNADKYLALSKLNANDITNEDVLGLYKRAKELYAKESKVDDVSSRLKSTKFDYNDPSRAQTQLDQFREDYRNVISGSPRLQQELQDKESEIKNASSIKPVNETLNQYVGSSQGNTNRGLYWGNNIKSINSDGTYQNLTGKTVSFADAKGSDASRNAQGLTSLLIKKDENGNVSPSDYLISAFNGYGINNIDTLVKETGIFKAAKAALDNKTLNDKYKNDYDALLEAYNYFK